MRLIFDGYEIYIISNCDSRSLPNIDLWENYIDNDDKMILFDQTPKEYDVSNLRNIDWIEQDRLVVEVAKRDNISAFHDVLDAESLRRML